MLAKAMAHLSFCKVLDFTIYTIFDDGYGAVAFKGNQKQSDSYYGFLLKNN